MSLEQFANNASTTLGSAASNVATTITVATGSGALFPAISSGQFFHATMFSAGSSTGLPNEIVKVTARTGDTMTVIRGQEGTSASAWSVGDTFANFPTAEFFNGVVQESDVQSQVGNAGVDTGVANQGIVTLSPVVTNLSSILYSPIRVLKVGSANTGAYTLIVNGLAAKPVLLNGVALAPGQLAASEIFEVIWDGTNFELISNPAQIENNQLAQMPAAAIKGNLGSSTAAPSDITLVALASALGIGIGILANPGEFSVPLLVGSEPVTGIIKFGYGTASSGGGISFAPPFPNACLGVLVGDSGNTPLAWSADKTTYLPSGFTIHNSINTNGSYIYIAMGY